MFPSNFSFPLRTDFLELSFCDEIAGEESSVGSASAIMIDYVPKCSVRTQVKNAMKIARDDAVVLVRTMSAGQLPYMYDYDPIFESEMFSNKWTVGMISFSDSEKILSKYPDPVVDFENFLVYDDSMEASGDLTQLITAIDILTPWQIKYNIPVMPASFNPVTYPGSTVEVALMDLDDSCDNANGFLLTPSRIVEACRACWNRLDGDTVIKTPLKGKLALYPW